MKRKIAILLATAMMVLVFTGCSATIAIVEKDNSLETTISSDWGWKTTKDGNTMNINFDDSLTYIGVKGGNAKITFLSDGRIKIDFDVELYVESTTYQVEEDLTEIFQKMFNTKAKIMSEKTQKSNQKLYFSILLGEESK